MSMPIFGQDFKSVGLERSKKRLFSVSCQLDKIETKAVEKFTTQYEKLCKTCPTRLQPRVETLIQMIVGLPPIEREELFSRIDAEGIRGGINSADGGQVEIKSNMIAPTIKLNTEFTPQLRISDTIKPEEDKMSKQKCKAAKTGRKLAVVRQLLAVFDTCSDPDFNPAPAATALAEEITDPMYLMEAQEKFAEALAELQRMPPSRRLERKMKLQEKQAKYERKMAEYAMEEEAVAGRECVARC
jgi:hypothetical protein